MVNLYQWFRGHWLKWISHRASPDTDDKAPEEIQAEAHALASEQNLRTTPPEGERVALRCLWAIEFFSPSHIDNLVDSLRRLRWSGERDMFESEDPVSWLSRCRREGNGGWKPLGFMAKHGTTTDLPDVARAVQLPNGVEYAHATMVVLTPSLVAVAVCFTFSDEASAVFEEVLRNDRQPISMKTRRGWEHYLPLSQKGNQVRQVRQELVKQAGTWFSENLPGIFSSGWLDSDIPTCELLTFRSAEPIPSRPVDDPVVRGYLMLLGVFWGTNAWLVSYSPGLKFNPPHHVFIGPRNHCVLTANESEIGTSPLHIDVQLMPGILCEGAILPLLDGYQDALRRVRDSVGWISRRQKNPQKVLETISASDSIDMTAVISELATAPKQGLRPFRSIPRLIPKEPSLSPFESLNEMLHIAVMNDGRLAQGAERATNERLTQFGSLLGAIENVRLQKKITMLTWVMVVIGIASTAVSVTALWLSMD